MYAEDYDAVSEIKKLADEFDVPILIIHHLKKAKEQSDWLNEFSGSQGIAGSADTLFALKRQRTDPRAILHRTGRDVEEKDFSMRIDRFGWVLEGDAELFTIPEWKRQIMDYLKEHDSVSPMNLAQTFNLSISSAQQNLHRLAKEGLIKKVGHGTYTLK
jgi:RecA-family ATPase